MAACCDPVYKRPSCRRTATHTRTAASGAPSSRRRSRSAGRSILTNLAQTGAHHHRRDPDGLARPGGARRGRARHQSLFRLPDLRHRPRRRATAPLIAQELGRKRHSVRDVRRTVRQGFWAAVAISVPIWVVLWNAEPILLLLGQEPALAAEAAPFVRTLQWAFLPFLWLPRAALLLLRAASGRAGSSRSGPLALPLNLAIAWVLMFGKLGFPPLGLAGAGVATTVSSLFMFVGLALVIDARSPAPALPPLRPLLACRTGARLRASSGGSACRSAARSLFEVDDLQRRRLRDGADRRRARSPRTRSRCRSRR